MAHAHTMTARALATYITLASLGGLAVWLAAEQPAPRELKPARTRTVWPGPQPDGGVQLPNQWSLRPAGTQIELGDFPVNLALHPSGRWLAVLHAGHGEHEIIIVDTQRRRLTCRVPIEQTFYGLCFSPKGDRLYASGGEFELVHEWQFEDGLLFRHQTWPVADEKSTFVVAGIAVDSEGSTLYAAGVFGDAVSIRPLQQDATYQLVQLPKQSHPYAVFADPGRRRLYVSLWAKEAVAVIDLETKQVTATWPTEKHPTEMVLAPDGKTLYVACANSTKVSVLDAETGRGLQTLHCALYPTAPVGNTPNSIALTPDGKVLFVANADNNNLAVFSVADRSEAKSLGFIPVGWYPTCVRYNPTTKEIYVTNGKGIMPVANPQGPQPGVPNAERTRQYIARLFRGTLSVVSLPTPEQMVQYTRQAYQCSPLRRDLGVTADREPDNPIPAKVGDPSPIKYCIYIIKENRTYDQVFGDMPQGNGDANLCLFPESVTPNHHKLAREFVLLDNFYVESEVSADGHEWSTAAYCTDFVERIWPLTYRGSPKKKLSFYPSEGEKEHLARPAGGYIWEKCREAGISYFSLGEFIAAGKTVKEPGRARVKSLEGHFDPWYRGWDLNYPDVKRAERFIELLRDWEQKGEMPRFLIMRLPNDHTAGTRVGARTPRAFVADNDWALGMVVEAASKSRFWKQLAIFVVEDDAQNGPDHVDAHRTVALVISPYTKRRFTDSNLYSTSSMLRTMELILGLQPMSQFDAAARPMYNSFTGKPDFTPYEAVRPQVDLDERNKPTAWGADLSEKMDLTKEDAIDDILFNEIIWRSVKGPDSPMPPPVRAAFVFPHIRGFDDDDD